MNMNNQPGTPHEVNIMRFDDDDDADHDVSDKPADFNLMPISRKLSISELRKMNTEEYNGSSNDVMKENNSFNENNNNDVGNKPISLQRRSISESRNQDNNKENEVQRRKLPPTLPSKKRTNKLEPLKQSEKINLENDVFKEENGFDLSFSETIKNKNRDKERQEKDSLDFLF